MNREPFEQQPQESEKAYHAFKLYRDMSPAERSIRAVGRKLGRTHQHIEKWAARFNWTERVKAWSAHVEEQERQARDAEARRKANQWTKRRDEEQEKNYKLAERLRARIDSMLEFPLATTKSKDGKTIVMPTSWTLGHVARLAEVATRLAALSLGLPTDRSEVTGKDGAPVVPVVSGQVVLYLPHEKPLLHNEET